VFMPASSPNGKSRVMMQLWLEADVISTDLMTVTIARGIPHVWKTATPPANCAEPICTPPLGADPRLMHLGGH
jgi:hypothetical protein